MINKKWKPCILLQVKPELAIVRMMFTHLPAQFNISTYEVSLTPRGTHGTEVTVQTNGTEVEFTKVKPAIYKVLVQPHANRNDCPVCTRTYSKPFTITKTNRTTFILQTGNCTGLQFPQESKIQSPTPKEAIHLPGILIAALLFVIFFSITVWFIIKHRHIFISRKYPELNNDSKPNPPEKDKMKLYIINTFDHEQHQKACESFMVYLHEHCFCEVLNLNENYKMIPDLADIQTSVNFIILIHSEGYSKQLNAWKERKLYPELCKSNPSILLQVMNSTMTNCVECAMTYTNPNYLAPTNSNKQLFIIPDNMTELVCYLHNINLDTIDEENIPLIEEHIYSSDDGLAMTKAIDRATEFELLHDDWFLRLQPYSFTI